MKTLHRKRFAPDGNRFFGERLLELKAHDGRYVLIIRRPAGEDLHPDAHWYEAPSMAHAAFERTADIWAENGWKEVS